MHTRRYVSTALIILTLFVVLFSSVPIIAGAQNTAREVARNKRDQQHPGNAQSASQAHATFVGGAYTLTATEISAQNAHLALLPNPLQPVLTFSSSTISGLAISHPLTTNTELIISASGTVTATGVAIKTSVLSDLKTSLASSTNPADLLILIAGGTVSNMVMKNVNLKIDSYIQSQSQNLPGFRLQVVNV